MVKKKIRRIILNYEKEDIFIFKMLFNIIL